MDLQGLKGEPTLLISSQLKDQIDYLHKKVGKKEWSGNLIYKIVEGDITEPDTLVMQAVGIYLMDVGTAGGTDFEMEEEDTIDMYDKFPELIESDEDYRIGLIHTHHNMNIYFSGVDNSELEDNARNYSPYLSLIVGFSKDYKARTAFVTEISTKSQTSFKFNNISDNETVLEREDEETKEVVCYYDCDVVVSNVSSEFEERYEAVKEKNKKTHTYQRGYGAYGYGGHNGYVRPYKGSKKAPSSKNDKSKNQKVNKDASDQITSLAQANRFCVKMLTGNPKSLSGNLHQALSPMKHSFKGSVGDLRDNIAECMEHTVGTADYDQMSLTQKIEFAEEVIEMLSENDISKPALTEQYAGARVLKNVLDNYVRTEEEYVIGFD